MFVMSQIWAGSSVVFVEQFDPVDAVEAIARYGVTGAGGPPVIMQAILAAPNLSPEKVRTLRTSGLGAADENDCTQQGCADGVCQCRFLHDVLLAQGYAGSFCQEGGPVARPPWSVMV